MTDPIYSLRPADALAALESSAQGITGEQAHQRQSLYGPNELREPPAPPLWRKVVRHAAEPAAILLIVAGAVTLITGHLEGLLIWGVVMVNGALAFWWERRAEHAILTLKQLLPRYSRVLRDGMETMIPAREIVPGDMLVLSEGDNISADARVIEAFGLRVNNTVLTGEALPALRTADASFADSLTEIERPNLVFAGTSVISGTGRAAVYATGMSTQFGRIASLTQQLAPQPSALQQEIRRLTRVLAAIAFALGVLIVIAELNEGVASISNILILFVGLVVATIPEGLLPIVTLSLASAARRLAHQGVLVKAFEKIETLGNASVICTDKSGTLTQNQMTVRKVWAGGRRMTVSGGGYEPKGQFCYESDVARESSSDSHDDHCQQPVPTYPTGLVLDPDLDALLVAAAMANNSRLNPPSKGNPKWTSLGDQTEAALRVAALKGGSDESMLRVVYPRIHELPFDARRKRMSTIHRDTRTPSGEIAFVKGAPNEVLARCTRVLINGEECPLNETVRGEISAANDDYAGGALRVLAVARRTWPKRAGVYIADQVERNMTFLGLMAMADPPRPEVAEAVKTCQQAGVRIVMITGDYGLTAESVARRVGILGEASPRILTGGDIEAMSDEQLREALDLQLGDVIFARMSPEHKLRVVDVMQARGEVVVVTGDGVNDAPALRKADVGVAMGVTGTDVAKEAADVVITDDNFAKIVIAIREGRAVHDNLRKAMTYIFASNVAEIAPFIATPLLHIPLALSVLQVLLIDLVTDLLPALALGGERPEPNIMRHPPRRRDQPIADRGLFLRAFAWLGVIEAVLCFIGYWLTYRLLGYEPLNLPQGIDPAVISVAATAYFAGVIAAQVGNAFACRTEVDPVRQMGWFSNRLLTVAVLIEIAIAVLAMAQPVASIRTQGQTSIIILFVAGFALNPVALYMLEWLRKRFVRLRRQIGVTTSSRHYKFEEQR